jgi:hypothetical protein
VKAVASEEKAIVRLHEAQNARELAQAIFSLIKGRLPHELLLLVLRPLEFELPLIGSDPKYQPTCDYYINGGHKHDLWLKRSPVHPGVDVVRHSDYTPLRVLKKSIFYKKILKGFGSESGTSMVAWRGDAWLAILTVLRNKKQGDITNSEMQTLLRWQVHFSSAVRKIANLHESRLGNRSLETFIWGLPTAAIVLDWELRVLHHNAVAEELCSLWRSEKERFFKKPRSF